MINMKHIVFFFFLQWNIFISIVFTDVTLYNSLQSCMFWSMALWVVQYNSMTFHFKGSYTLLCVDNENSVATNLTLCSFTMAQHASSFIYLFFSPGNNIKHKSWPSVQGCAELSQSFEVSVDKERVTVKLLHVNSIKYNHFPVYWPSSSQCSLKQYR